MEQSRSDTPRNNKPLKNNQNFANSFTYLNWNKIAFI